MQIRIFKVSSCQEETIKKFADDFCIVYNKAWAKHEGNKQLNKEVAYKMFKAMKPVMDENLIWFVYHNDEPIAFWVNLPELNQIFKHFNGRFGFFEKLKYLWLKKKALCNKFTGIVFGVVPEYQGKGIDYYMIVEGAKVIQKKNNIMNWNFNGRVISILKF